MPPRNHSEACGAAPSVEATAPDVRDSLTATPMPSLSASRATVSALSEDDAIDCPFSATVPQVRGTTGSGRSMPPRYPWPRAANRRSGRPVVQVHDAVVVDVVATQG